MDYELELDQSLNIKTSGRDDTIANYQNFPYEPTPYVVLERLSNSGYISKKDKLVDYGCGKGRVDFYLAFYNKCKMIGIEYDERLFKKALENKDKSNIFKANFYNINALDYSLEENTTGAYFFNPFSVKILKDVINNIINYVNNYNITFKLYFYYISDSYIKFLDEFNNMKLIDIIDCTDLFTTYDSKEVIRIYEVNKTIY